MNSVVSNTVISRSQRQTEMLGEQLAALLGAGDIVTLSGPLGAGKTVLARNIARGLGVEDSVTSPSYTIVNEYAGTKGTVYHIDTYRLTDSEEFAGIGGAEILMSGGICIIEWPERIENMLPPPRLKIQMSILDYQSREIHYDNRC